MAMAGPRFAEQQAKSNAEEAQRIGNIWSNGNDSFTKGSTIPLSQLDARRRSGYRYMAANDPSNKTGREVWQTADGTNVNEDQIRAGHKQYGTASARQANYHELLKKTASLTPERQNMVFEDFLASANDAGMDAGNASGSWQGISIPFKSIRIDQRRQKIEKDPSTGQLVPGGVDHAGVLKEYSGMSMGQQIEESAGSYQAIRDAIDWGVASGNTEHEEYASRAYHNLVSYVDGAPAPAGAVAAASGAGSPGAGASGAATYANSASAAAKNRNAAQQALGDLKSSMRGPTVTQHARVLSRLPRDIT